MAFRSTACEDDSRLQLQYRSSADRRCRDADQYEIAANLRAAADESDALAATHSELAGQKK
jgi:hypothetical protein